MRNFFFLAIKLVACRCFCLHKQFVGTLQAFDGSEGNSKGLVVNVLGCLILNYMIVIYLSLMC